MQLSLLQRTAVHPVFASSEYIMMNVDIEMDQNYLE